MTVRPCAICGTPTTGRWCSTGCHRADEPGAYEEEEPVQPDYDEEYEADHAADWYEKGLGR